MPTRTNMATMRICEIIWNKLNMNRSRGLLLPWYCCPLLGTRYPVFHWTSYSWRWSHYLVSKRFVTNTLWWITTLLLCRLGGLKTHINMTKATVKIGNMWVLRVCVCVCVCVYVYVYVCMCVCVFLIWFIQHAPLQSSNATCFLVILL